MAMDGLATDDICTLLRWVKDGPAGTIPIDAPDRSLGRLQAVTWEDACDRSAVERLFRWHELAFAWFPEPFPVTPEGARRWLVDRVLSDPRRILFWVRDVRGEAHAHVGLTAIDLDAGTATVGDVITCHPGAAPLAAAAVESLARWVRWELGLRVERASQARAIAA
jgi:RimJ/RimL family protein N-acetyltransferase